MMIALWKRWLIPNARTLSILVPLLFIAVCSVWTVQRNAVWSNSLRFWTDCARKSPNKARPNFNVGFILHAHGKVEEAARHFLRAIDIEPPEARVHNHSNMGKLYMETHEFKWALSTIYREILALRPDHVEASYNIAKIFWLQGASNEAIAQYEKTVKLDPRHWKAYRDLGKIYRPKKDYQKAWIYYQKPLKTGTEHQADLPEKPLFSDE